VPHEAAIREVKEELWIDVEVDVEYHWVDENLASHMWAVPSPIMTYKNTIPIYKDQPEHIHCDFWYILIWDESHPFGGESNQSKRMTKEEILAIPDDETFLSVKDMANTYLI